MTDLVTVEEVAAELRWKAQQITEYGELLGSYISGATPVIESIAGPVVARTIEELHNGGLSSVALRNTPNDVVAVQYAGGTGGSWVDGYFVVGDGWNAVDGWAVDGDLIRVPGRFPAGVRNIRVTYTVGFDVIPENVKRATVALVVYNWRRVNPQQQNSEELFAVPEEYAIPAATYQWLRPQQNTRPAGFA